MQANQQELVAIRQTVDAGTPLPQLVDDLTALEVEIAVLEAKAKNIKAALIKSGLKEICGSQTRAVVSHIDAGVSISWQKVAEYVQAPAEVVQLFAKKRDAYDKVALYGYN